MKMISLILAAMLMLCGCHNAYQQTKDIMQQMPLESSSNTVEQQSQDNKAAELTEFEVTQPPCLACEDEAELNPVTEQTKEISEEEKKEQIYASNAPAKQSWIKAYQTFYSSDMRPSQQYLDVISSTTPYKRAQNNLELRSDIGIDFVYPVYEMPFLHIETVAYNGSMPGVAIKCAAISGLGMLVNYKSSGSYAGEILFGEDDIFAGEFIYNGDSLPTFTPFEQGNYIARTSLTITEGIEAQLIDFGFLPANTSAFALRLTDNMYGICFYDDEKAAYYNNIEVRGISLQLKLYSFEELRDELCKIFDVCSVEEIDVILKSDGQAQEIVYDDAVDKFDTGSHIPQPDGINEGEEVLNPLAAKPVIYLYPEQEIEVLVKLGYPAEHFTYTYPQYNDGWQVTAYPDGRMINKADGSEHYYLFWEGNKKIDWDMSEGFVVKGDEITDFLREKLSCMGLTPREYNDFITYWVPEMSRNKYNLISFSWQQYEQLAPLEIIPVPDEIFRVHMVYKAVDEPFEIMPQQLPQFCRRGFSVLEWGGSRA